MKTLWLIFSVIALAFAWVEKSYLDYWKSAGYSAEETKALSEQRNCDKVADALRSSSTPQATFELGKLYYARGLYRQALGFFKNTDFGGDLRKLYIGLCYLVLGENDSAKSIVSTIADSTLRPWSSAILGKISGTKPVVVGKYRYLSGFWGEETDNEQGQDKFTLQFGAFSKRELAEALSEKLKAAGLEPYIMEVRISDKTLFRVRHGHFNSREEAEQVGEAIGDQFIFQVVPE